MGKRAKRRDKDTVTPTRKDGEQSTMSRRNIGASHLKHIQRTHPLLHASLEGHMVCIGSKEILQQKMILTRIWCNILQIK